METKIENNEALKSDEVTIADLFSVCVRYRYLIIFGTLLVTLFSFLYLYIGIRKAGNPKIYSVTYVVDTELIPDSALKNGFESESTANLALQVMTDPVFLADVNSSACYWDYVEAANDRDGYVSYVNSQIGTGINFKVQKLNKEVQIKAAVEQSKLESYKNMIKLLVDSADPRLNEIIIPFVESKANEGDKASIEFAKSEHTFLFLSDPLLVDISPSRSIAKKTILAFFVSFFISVLLAFILNAVKNMKNDKDSMDKISSAWKAGKIMHTKK